MTRTLIHAMFGAVAICCAAVAVYGWARLQHAEQVNQAIAAASAATGDPREDRANDEAPQVRLARATALSKAGAYDRASRLYGGLISDDHPDDLGRAALFDLGNMYLREGGGDGAANTVKSLAMIGEAKTRYRLVLRAAPDDWDARYNLERALWLAPEVQSALEVPDVKEQHNVKLRGAQSQDLP